MTGKPAVAGFFRHGWDKRHLVQERLRENRKQLPSFIVGKFLRRADQGGCRGGCLPTRLQPKGSLI